VRIDKTRHGAKELKFSRGQLPGAKIGKFLHHRVLARHDFREVKIHLGANSPGFGVACQVHDFRRVKQRFRGHATAQDAKSTQFVAALDDDGLKPRGGGTSRSGIATAAAADDRHIKIVFLVRLHSATIAESQSSYIIKKGRAVRASSAIELNWLTDCFDLVHPVHDHHQEALALPAERVSLLELVVEGEYSRAPSAAEDVRAVPSVEPEFPGAAPARVVAPVGARELAELLRGGPVAPVGGRHGLSAPMAVRQVPSRQASRAVAAAVESLCAAQARELGFLVLSVRDIGAADRRQSEALLPAADLEFGDFLTPAGSVVGTLASGRDFAVALAASDRSTEFDRGAAGDYQAADNCAAGLRQLAEGFRGVDLRAVVLAVAPRCAVNFLACEFRERPRELDAA